MKPCPCIDDAGQPCSNLMTEEEEYLDGICWDCADSIWNSQQNNTKFIRNKDGRNEKTSGRQPL